MWIRVLENYLSFFSDKVKSSENVKLVESDKIFTKDAKNAEDLNTIFLNTVENCKIPDMDKSTPFSEKLSHPILKSILKYNKSRRIIAIINVTNGWTFQFSCVNVDDISKEAKTTF